MAINMKQIAAMLSAMLMAGSLSAANNSDCGRFADLGLFMVDYSGSMNEVFATPKVNVETKLEVALEAVEQLVEQVPTEAELDVGVVSFGPHVVLVPPGRTNPKDFQKAMSQLPRKLEIFGRHTTLGEGLQGFAQRIQMLKRSSEERERHLGEAFDRPTALVIVTDGGEVNRGLSIQEGWNVYKQRVSFVKPVILSVAQTDEERKGVQALSQLIGAQVFEASSIVQHSEDAKQFVTHVFYRPCPKFDVTFSADTLFGFDKDQLTENGQAEIRRFARLLNENAEQIRRQGIVFSISAHTDRIGTQIYNDKLSERRLNAVLNELRADGVDLSLFVERRALGETMPVTGDACRGLRNADVIHCLQPDRRVEIREIRHP